MTEVAIALSGGGFRAAMFHLGTLYYLHHLRYEDGCSFLDDVNTISTISGGTLTGLWYMMCYIDKRDMDEAIAELYQKMVKKSLPNMVLPRIINSDNEATSLIAKMVEVYDEVFFDGRKFGEIMQAVENGHLHHFCASGTDFGNGIPFRFQATRMIKNVAESVSSHGFIGNGGHRVPEDVAAQIRLSEIMAVSSCFPGGFEAMRFPEDFAFSREEGNADYMKNAPRMGIMDGGIDDNQGIEPIEMANQHLTYDDPRAKKKDNDDQIVTDKDYPCHDLIIISDVANPQVPQENSKGINCCKKINLLNLHVFFFLALIASVSLIVFGYNQRWMLVSGIVLTTLANPFCFILMLIDFGLLYAKRKISFQLKLRDVMQVSVYKFIELIRGRYSTVKLLVMTVFMKHIRKMQYRTLYEKKAWENRLVSNNLSELSSKGSWRWKKTLPSYLHPSDKMKANTDVVANWDSTLWFTAENLENKFPECLFTAGQYTICMNLLEYIDKLKKDNTNVTDFHERLMQLEPQLRSDWSKFMENPQFMKL